jgi:hypothetical protein
METKTKNDMHGGSMQNGRIYNKMITNLYK